MTHPYLHSLCVEYVELVDSMRGGMHDDHHALDSQRQITHNQLLEITGLTRADDMYLYAKQVLAEARARGLLYRTIQSWCYRS